MLDLARHGTVTFDCYGTLIDWESGIADALGPILARHGVELDREELLERYARLEAKAEAGEYRPYRRVLRRVVDGFGRELGFRPAEEERRALEESVATWPPFPDTRKALARLGRHRRLVVISNVDDDLFAGTARRLGVDFHRVFTAQQARAYKPAERAFTHALGELDARRDEILHVAQSLFHDVAPARRLGLATAWIDRRRDRGGFGATPPAAATPDLALPDLASLADAVEAAGGHST